MCGRAEAQYATINALEIASPGTPPASQTASVAGYYAPNDGGGSTLTATTGALSGCSGGETSGFQYSIASIPGAKNPVHAGSLLLAEAPPLGHNGVALAIDPSDPAVTPAMLWQACAVAVGSATTGTAYPIGSAVRAISNH